MRRDDPTPAAAKQCVVLAEIHAVASQLVPVILDEALNEPAPIAEPVTVIMLLSTNTLAV
eukprot:2672460-Rhodomonas_salina.1